MPIEEACIDAIISDDQHPNKDEAINSIYRSVRDGSMDGEEFREFMKELIEAVRLEQH
jgi:hypothetical protein